MQQEHYIRRFFHSEFPTYPIGIEELCQSLVSVNGKRLRDAVKSVLATHRSFIDVHLSRVNTRSVKAADPTFLEWLGSVVGAVVKKETVQKEEEVFDI